MFQDAMTYVGLFLSIRSGDWHLRMASMKQMAPVFTAFDHPNYQKLIGRHLADVLCMPTQVLTMFKQGAFVASVSGRAWHSIGIDEAHKMLINRACKTSIMRPNPDYINRIAWYIPFRSKTLENLRKQLFPEERLQSGSSIITSILYDTGRFQTRTKHRSYNEADTHQSCVYSTRLRPWPSKPFC